MVVIQLILCYVQNGVTALYMAAVGGHVECVRLLLDAGAVVDRVDKVSVSDYLTSGL